MICLTQLSGFEPKWRGKARATGCKFPFSTWEKGLGDEGLFKHSQHFPPYSSHLTATSRFQ